MNLVARYDDATSVPAMPAASWASPADDYYRRRLDETPFRLLIAPRTR